MVLLATGGDSGGWLWWQGVCGGGARGGDQWLMAGVIKINSYCILYKIWAVYSKTGWYLAIPFIF